MGGTLSMSSIRGNSEKVFSHLYKLWFKYELSHYQQSQLPCQEHRNKGNNLTCMGSFFFFFFELLFTLSSEMESPVTET